MKFIIEYPILFLFMYIIFISNICFCISSGSELKIQVKRENSVMEFFNNFFREDNFSQNIYDNSDIKENDNIGKMHLQNIRRSKSKIENNYLDKINEGKFLNGNNDYKNEFSFKESTSNNISINNQSLEPKIDKDRDGNRKSDIKLKTDSKNNLNNNIILDKKFLDKVKTEPNKNTEILIEDWFMISSFAFHDSDKFPPIKMNDDTYVAIKTDQKNFRINHGFNYFEEKDKPPSKKFFWLRLSGLNLYYSTSKCDLNILGVISVSHLESITELSIEIEENYQILCFRVNDNFDEIWKICGMKEESVKIIYCNLNNMLDTKEKFCSYERVNDEKIKSIIQPLIIIPKPSRKCNQGWNYNLKGNDWECDCSEGMEQSPIDLPEIEEALESPISPLFHYFNVNSIIEEDSLDEYLKKGENLKITIIENAIKIFHHNFGKVVTADGSVYKAEEIVIHTPSEHTIHGKKFDAEMQIIHYGQTKGDIAKQVVLSILFENTPGEYNKFFESLDIFNLPNVLNKEKKLFNNLFIPEVFYSSDETVNINSMKKFSFFTYQGSLTFPPCTENTILYVTSKPIPLSTTTIKLLQEAIRSPDINKIDDNIYLSEHLPENDRLVQKRNGRPVFYYNHQKYCGPDKPKKKKAEGHYEKIIVKKKEILYVDGMKPLLYPEAFVISKDEAFGENRIKKITEE